MTTKRGNGHKTEDELEYDGQMMAGYYVMWKDLHEMGIKIERHLLNANIIEPGQRLFFNREERRALTRTDGL